jgi:hypothetical protein
MGLIGKKGGDRLNLQCVALKTASYEVEVEDVEINPGPGVSSNPSLTSTNDA